MTRDERDTVSTYYLHTIYTVSTQYLLCIYTLSTQYLHTIYALYTQYLHTIYTLSTTQYLLTPDDVHGDGGCAAHAGAAAVLPGVRHPGLLQQQVRRSHLGSTFIN